MVDIRLNDGVQEYVQLAIERFRHLQGYNGRVEFSEDDPNYIEMLRVFKERKASPEVVFSVVNELLNKYTRLTQSEKKYAVHIINTNALISLELDGEGEKFDNIRALLEYRIPEVNKDLAKMEFAEANVDIKRKKLKAGDKIDPAHLASLSKLVDEVVDSTQSASKTLAKSNRRNNNLSSSDKINQKVNEIKVQLANVLRDKLRDLRHASEANDESKPSPAAAFVKKKTLQTK